MEGVGPQGSALFSFQIEPFWLILYLYCMRKFLQLILFLIPGIGLCQTPLSYRLTQEIPVIEGDSYLETPWGGGLNAVQVGEMDFSGDGINDLVIWERFSNSLKLFKRNGEDFEYSPEYLQYFPILTSWMLLEDLNNDGKKDIITYHPLGMSVYLNTSSGNLPEWRQFNEGRELRTQGINGPVNIAMNEDDLPGIADIDGDGKVDIVTFAYLSNSIEYNRNISTTDSLIFERISTEWGDFEVCSCGIYAFGGPCNPSQGGRIEHTGPKALFLDDMDGDGDQDLAISEDECGVIFALENVGTPSGAVFRNPANDFPSAQNPVNGFFYPTLYKVDLNNDGKRDIVTGIHLKTNARRVNDFANSIQYFENVSTGNVPEYQFRKSNLLQEDMVELGESASPTLFDIDSDGDDDLFVGRMGEFTSEGQKGSIYFYRNIGDQVNPQFQLEDKDWLNLSAINLNNIKPQFIDINGDKNIDLAMTASVGREFQVLVIYLLNNAFWGFDYEPTIFVDQNAFLFRDENALFHDLDEDGDADLLITRGSGQVDYFEFSSTLGVYNEMGEFYGMGIDAERSDASLLIDDLDGSGVDDLVLFTKTAGIKLYRDFKSDLSNPVDPEELMFTYKGDELGTNFKLGSSLRATSSTIFNEDLPALIVGTGEGGLQVLRNENAVVNPFSEPYTFTPSNFLGPENDAFTLEASKNIAFDIITATGQQITPAIKIPTGESLLHSVRNLSDGLYLVRVYTNKGTFRVRKLVISR